MHYTFLIILIALVQYLYFTGKVGFSRGKYNVSAPKTVGDEVWERIFRVQQNTMEQLIVFIPGMLMFAHFVSELWVILPGVVFIVGRAVFSQRYVADPSSRGVGVVMSFFSNIALVLGAIIGLALKMM